MNQGVGQYIGESLGQTLARSRCHKGRLLYYFPKKFRYILQTNYTAFKKLHAWRILLLVVLVKHVHQYVL
jgi:hypothetical protein